MSAGKVKCGIPADKTYCDLKKELEENAKEYEEYPKKLKACIEGYQETEEAIELLS